jgi:hypothetical protein
MVSNQFLFTALITITSFTSANLYTLHDKTEDSQCYLLASDTKCGCKGQELINLRDTCATSKSNTFCTRKYKLLLKSNLVVAQADENGGVKGPYNGFYGGSLKIDFSGGNAVIKASNSNGCSEQCTITGLADAGSADASCTPS